MSNDTSKTDRPKRKSRKMQIDAFNPDTWPADSKRRLEREMHIKDIMVGRKISNSPKAMYMEEFRLKDSDAYGKNVWMDEELLLDRFHCEEGECYQIRKMDNRVVFVRLQRPFTVVPFPPGPLWYKKG